MRVSYSTLVKAKRSGRATSVRVAPTGTAVSEYQVPLGNRYSLREAGVIGLPSWSDKTTQSETWTKVPRLSATCPRRVVAFDGGRGDIDRCMEFGDEFDGTAIDGALWTTEGAVTVGSGIVAITRPPVASLNGLVSVSDVAATGVAVVARVSHGKDGNTYCPDYSGYSQIYWDSSISQYRAHSYSTGSNLTNLGNTYTGYHTYEIRRNGATNTVFAVDGAIVATHTTQLDNNARKIRAVSNKTVGGTLLVDWIAIRKYTPNEPLAGTAQPNATSRALSRPMSHADLMRACCT